MELSKPSPVCTLLPKSAVKALQCLCEGDLFQENPRNLETLILEAPIVFSLLKGFDSIPAFAVPLFQLLIQIVEETFSGEEARRYPSQGDSILNYYPSLPKLTERGHFKMDGKKTCDSTVTFFLLSIYVYILDLKHKKQKQKDSCRKALRVHPTLTSGVLTTVCQHGLVLGFSVMRGHESPDDCFEVLETRFEKGFSF